jgi:hypothetical protein
LAVCICPVTSSLAKEGSDSCQRRKHRRPDQKITDVIRSGSVLGRAPIVSMPHWGGIIPDGQLQALVAYIKT